MEPDKRYTIQAFWEKDNGQTGTIEFPFVHELSKEEIEALCNLPLGLLGKIVCAFHGLPPPDTNLTGIAIVEYVKEADEPSTLFGKTIEELIQEIDKNGGSSSI